MPSPFPGMDPYLERPSLWPDVHHELISQVRAALNPTLRPKYVARVETRVYVSDDLDPGRELMVPDVHIEILRPSASLPGRSLTQGAAVAESLVFSMLMEEEIVESFIAIREAGTAKLVTVIEILSPTNKAKNSRGQKSFLKKRQEILGSEVHWVEIDLLRFGERSPRRPPKESCHYRVIASRGDDRDHSRCWPIVLRNPLPTIGIPLKGRDEDARLDLKSVLNLAYEIGAYDTSIDYAEPPDPPLSPADAKWANALLRAKRLR